MSGTRALSSPCSKAWLSRRSASRCSASLAPGLAASHLPARAGPRRGLRGLAVELFGLGLLRAVAAGDLHVGEADLGVGVTHRGQGLVVALGGGEVAALQGLLGQALVGQSGAAGGQGDG